MAEQKQKQELIDYLATAKITESGKIDMAWELIQTAVTEEHLNYPSIRLNFAPHHHGRLIEITKSLKSSTEEPLVCETKKVEPESVLESEAVIEIEVTTKPVSSSVPKPNPQTSEPSDEAVVVAEESGEA